MSIPRQKFTEDAIVGRGDEPVSSFPKSKITRDTRKPFGSTDQKLAYPARPGYHRHWFNDEPGRIHAAEQAGYTYVNDYQGKVVSQVVGTTKGGGPQTGYLMEIPLEWYDEDMKRLQDGVNEKEKGIRRGAVEKSDMKDTDRFYAGSDKGKIDIHDSFSKAR